MPQSTPDHVEAVTPEWLTSVLRADGTLDAQSRVQEVSAERIAVGTGFLSDLFRLRLKGAGPSSLILKFPSSTDLYREMGESNGAYEREVVFYREVAPHSPMRTPRAYLAEFGSDGSGVLLLEDLGHLEAPDHIEGLPPNRVGTVLEQLAAHHAWSISDGSPDFDPVLFQTLDERFSPGSNSLNAIPTAWSMYCENRRTPHSAAIDELVATLPARVPALVESLAEPHSLAHGDLRVDNLFFDENAVVIVDHQFPLFCSGLYDVAYLVSQGLQSADRNGRDRDFVEHYRQAAAAAGLHISDETAWRQYCDAVLLLLVFPLGAILGWPILGERAQELVLTLIERWIDTVAALGLAGVESTRRV